MGSKFMIALSAENRQAAGVQGGDKMEVTIELDLEPRTVEIPKAFRKSALIGAGALEAFENSAPSMRKEYVRSGRSESARNSRSVVFQRLLKN